jgi:phasin family protein
MGACKSNVKQMPAIEELNAMAAKKKTGATPAKAATPVESAVTASRESIEAAVEAGKQNLDAAMKAGVETASKSYDQAVVKTKAQVEQAVALTKENVDKASEAAFKGYDEFAILGKGNFDALVQSNTMVAKGFETLSKEFMAFAQSAVEANISHSHALFGAKNLKEVADLHNDFARKSLDKTITETAKLTELSVQVTNEAIEPLQKRVDVTVETLLKAQAA